MRTTDQLFILRHLLARFAENKHKLYMCFVDFQKAYDSVRRDLMLHRLAELGVCGNMLRAVAGMYSSVPMCARQGGQLSPQFDSSLGVKQGDPMSPLLFGLFLDGLERYMGEHAAGTGVEVGETLCQMLLYADDIVMLATSRRALQRQLDALHGFCTAQHMSVNVAKTKVLVFNGGKHPCGELTYAGQTLEVVDSFRYLGVELHRSKGFAVAPAVVRSAATKAVCGLMRQVKDRELSHIGLRVQLFGGVVMPVLQFGCEVWGPAFLRDPARPMANPLQPVHTQFLRQVASEWLRKSVSTKLLLAEFGCQPVAWQWCKLVCRYWNRLASQDHYPLLRGAFIAEMQRAAGGNPGWGLDVLTMLQQCDASVHDSVVQAVADGDWDHLPQLSSSVILQQWRAWWDWPDRGCDPRTAADGMLATYAEWVSEDPGRPAPYVASCDPISVPRLLSLVRFRVGAHHLRVCTGRWDGTPREQRLCRKCALQQIEDEKHVLFECPWYAEVRQQFSSLFDDCGGSPRELLAHANQHKVANLIFSIEQRFFETE